MAVMAKDDFYKETYCYVGGLMFVPVLYKDGDEKFVGDPIPVWHPLVFLNMYKWENSKEGRDV